MSQTLESNYVNGYTEASFAQSPFADPRQYENEEPSRESFAAASPAGSWEVVTPFESGQWNETTETEAPTLEAAAMAELATELKDSEFREALEQLAGEALETHADQLAGEYGDRETRDRAAERLLNDHFLPLVSQTETMLDRFAARVEGYDTEALTESEIDRIIGEILPTQPLSPASEQFLGSFGRKLGKIVSGAIKAPLQLAGKGLALAGKLALGPLLAPLKKLARFLLQHVVKFAINKLPLSLRPLAQKLSDRLFHETGATHDHESEEYEQTEAEAIPAGPDIAHLEAEFDLHAAQLLQIPDEAEADHLVSAYGEQYEQGPPAPLAAIDQARAELADGLARLQPGETAQPVIEHFLPVIAAVWPALKAGIGLIGRDKVVKFIGGALAALVKPIIGPDGAKLIGAPLANVGLRLFGFETGNADPRAFATEALAATIEETATRLGELPPHVFENETLLGSAVQEAFENAATTYFPPGMIKSELRRTADQDGVWRRMPEGSPRKRYAKYTETPQVTITPNVAGTVHSFGGNTLRDHLHDHMNIPPGQTVKTNIRLYQALPGTRAADIARAERIPAHHLHPLTPHAAGALLGKNSGLGSHTTPAAGLAHHHRLHLHQRLYYIEPPGGRQHLHHRHHVRLARSELLINLRRGEIRIWLFLGERLCQQVSAELAKPNNAVGAFRLVKHLVHRPSEMLRAVILQRHLPPSIRVIGETPKFDTNVPPWLVQIGRQLAAKTEEWAAHQVAQYLRNNAEEFRRLSAAHHDGVTLRITMSRIPGIEMLRLVAQGRIPKGLEGGAWLKGTPAFAVHAHPGYAIR